jgi:hypothetical protein
VSRVAAVRIRKVTSREHAHVTAARALRSAVTEGSTGAAMSTTRV